MKELRSRIPKSGDKFTLVKTAKSVGVLETESEAYSTESKGPFKGISQTQNVTARNRTGGGWVVLDPELQSNDLDIVCPPEGALLSWNPSCLAVLQGKGP